MKSYKRHIYKTTQDVFTNIVDTPEEASCNTTIEAEGNIGIYEVDIYLGTEVGKSGIRYDGIFFPDRFEIIYDGEVVADSKFVGDGLSTLRDDLLGTRTLSVYRYTNGQFVDTGETRTITTVESDIAPSGTSGDGTLLFEKNKANVKSITLRVTGTLEATAWTISSICPYTGTLPEAGKPFDLRYDKIRSTIDCENFPRTLVRIYTSGEDIAEGVKVYKDIQLMNIPVNGFYKRLTTIYQVENGVITDEIPCGGIMHYFDDGILL